VEVRRFYRIALIFMDKKTGLALIKTHWLCHPLNNANWFSCRSNELSEDIFQFHVVHVVARFFRDAANNPETSWIFIQKRTPV
jgi:hypothetical protein